MEAVNRPIHAFLLSLFLPPNAPLIVKCHILTSSVSNIFSLYQTHALLSSPCSFCYFCYTSVLRIADIIICRQWNKSVVKGRSNSCLNPHRLFLWAEDCLTVCRPVSVPTGLQTEVQKDCSLTFFLFFSFCFQTLTPVAIQQISSSYS